MEKIDTRKKSQEVQRELRRQIVRLKKKGMTNKEVSEALEVSGRHVWMTWSKYRKDGQQAIVLGVRGRQAGEKRTLSFEHEKELKKLLVDKTPDQLRLSFALWTRQAVQEVIKERYGIEMPIRTVGEYLKRWGFTPQKPAKRAYEQNSKAVQEWLDEEYPVIHSRAKMEDAEILWGDETGVNMDAYYARGYSPKGKTPVVRLNVKKQHVSMISAISNGGKVRFMLYDEGMNADRLITFMKRLIKDVRRKVFLILDNLRAHHSNKVREWLQEHKDEIEVLHLPSYSPELNPDEYLNNDLKMRVHSGNPARSKKDLEYKTRSFMKTLQKRPQHVKNYFKHQAIAYAA